MRGCNVKDGKYVSIADSHALHSVLEREEPLMAVLIIMYPLGEAAVCSRTAAVARAGEKPGCHRRHPLRGSSRWRCVSAR